MRKWVIILYIFVYFISLIKCNELKQTNEDCIKNDLFIISKGPVKDLVLLGSKRSDDTKVITSKDAYDNEPGEGQVIEDYHCGTGCLWTQFCHGQVYSNHTGTITCVPCRTVCDISVSPDQNKTYQGLSKECFEKCHETWQILVSGASPAQESALQSAVAMSISRQVPLLDFKMRTVTAVISVIVSLILVLLGIKACEIVEDKYSVNDYAEDKDRIMADYSNIDQTQAEGRLAEEVETSMMGQYGTSQYGT